MSTMSAKTFYSLVYVINVDNFNSLLPSVCNNSW